MRLLLQNTSGDGTMINTVFGIVQDGETQVVVDLPTARFLEVKSLLDGTTNLAYQILEGAQTAAWVDAPGLLTGTATSQSFTISGVDAHSTARVNFGGSLPAGCIADTQCTAANTVVVTVANFSGSTVDVPATTLDVSWTNPAAL